jgi:glycosyltransferase involved in cell wall biosynthesis
MIGGTGIDPATLPRLDPTNARARLGLPANADVLLYLGRKEPYKGLPSLVRAFAALHARHPSLHLVSAGPSTEESRQLRADYAFLPRWSDLDTVDDATKLDLLNACDLLVLPSTGEAFGIVFLEAWAVGKPVIGARAGAIPWVIQDGHDGLLVEPHDDADLAVKIEQLVTAPELRRRLAANGKLKLLQRYTVERIAGRIEQIYARVLSGSGLPAVLPA